MAAGAGGSLESTLDKKFQNVTNTMDSIQGLSTWCIDNKKYHSLIVRHWIKCLRKSDASHRLNLFYLANDVIQNCKRKNAIVYRTAFAEVLRDAFLLINVDGDHKVIKAVERILSIWEDRGVYSGSLITELRSSLVKEESPPETPVEQKTPVETKADLRSKVVAEFVPQALIDELSKYKRSVDEVDLREKQLAAMRVNIFSTEALKKLKDKAGGKKFSKDFEEGSAQLQEFVKLLNKHCKTTSPLMEALSNADIFYETQYKEVKIVANAYQTFANRVSHLKRKLDSLKATMPDMDESPIPSPSADAPSPTGSESPFHGMELADPDPDLDGSAMDDEAEPPAPSPLSSPGGSPKDMQMLGETDNRQVEDMELSDEEVDNSSGIIVEERVERPTHPELSTPVPAKTEPSMATQVPVTQLTPFAAAPAAAHAAAPTAAHAVAPAPAHAAAPAAAHAAAPTVAHAPAHAAAPTAAHAAAPTAAHAAAPAAAHAPALAPAHAPAPASAPTAAHAAAQAAAYVAGVEGVDLAKIGSILNSLSSVMKNTGPSVESPPPAAPAAALSRSTAAPSVVLQDASSLVNILSKVDVSPADLLSALSKVQGQGSHDGINPLLSSPSTNVSSDSSSRSQVPPASTPSSSVPPQSSPLSSLPPVPSLPSSTVRQSTDPQTPSQTSNAASALVQALHRDMDLTTDPEPPSSESLESKIHSFLQGNSAFNAFDLGFAVHPVQGGGENLSPVTGADNQGGTPVRDEGGSTPTQDEIMDKPVVAPFTSNQPSSEETLESAPIAYHSSSQQIPNNPQQQAPSQPGMTQNGQLYQAHPHGPLDMSEHGITAPVAHYQQVSSQIGGPASGDRAPGCATNTPSFEGFKGVNERGRYGDIYPEVNSQQPAGYNVTAPGGSGDNASRLYPYQAEQTHQLQELTSQQGSTASAGFFRGPLPPVPKFPPPPPQHFDAMTSSAMIPPKHLPMPRAGTEPGLGPRVDSVISGMVVHDHQHKSMFHSDDPPYGHDQPHRPRPEGLHTHPDDLRYHEDPERFHDEPRYHDPLVFQENPYHQQDDPYSRPGSPPHHYPRVRGRLTPPLSPAEDPYFAHDFQRRCPPPPHYLVRRPPPPHLEIRHRGLRPHHRPPHPAHLPHPRGPPRAPFPRFQGPDPRLRGKRPGPRGGGNDGPMFGPKRPFPPPRY